MILLCQGQGRCMPHLPSEIANSWELGLASHTCFHPLCTLDQQVLNKYSLNVFIEQTNKCTLQFPLVFLAVWKLLSYKLIIINTWKMGCTGDISCPQAWCFNSSNSIIQLKYLIFMYIILDDTSLESVLGNPPLRSLTFFFICNWNLVLNTFLLMSNRSQI